MGLRAYWALQKKRLLNMKEQKPSKIYNEKRIIKNKPSINELQDFKWPNMCIIEVSKKEHGKLKKKKKKKLK